MSNEKWKIVFSLSHIKEDHLHDVYDQKRQHERGRNDVRRQPDFQQTMQIDKRFHAPQSRRSLDSSQQQVALLFVFESRKFGLELKTRPRKKRGQLLAASVLPQ